MSRAKGTAKTGGRAKGTQNKVTTDLKTWIQELLDENRDQIKTDLTKLEPYQRVVLFEKLLSYTVPKMQSVEAKVEDKQVREFNIGFTIEDEIDAIIKKL